MKRYFNSEQPRYVFYVRECLNGFSLQVLNIDRDENYPLTPAVAGQLLVTLPDTYRLQSCTREAAEKELDRLADLNEWTEVN